MNSSEFDQRFEAGDTLTEALDLSAARHSRQEQKHVDVDYPICMVKQFERLEARAL